MSVKELEKASLIEMVQTMKALGIQVSLKFEEISGEVTILTKSPLSNGEEDDYVGIPEEIFTYIAGFLSGMSYAQEQLEADLKKMKQLKKQRKRRS